MKLSLPETLIFERADKTKIIAPAVSRGQIREVYELDRKKVKSLLALAERRGQQVEIFLRHAKWVKADDARKSAGTLQELFTRLTAAEEIDIIHAFIAQHHGEKPENAAQLQAVMREILKKKTTGPALTT